MPIGLGSREEVRAWPRCWFREGQPWLHYPSRSNLRWLAASGLDIPPLGPDTGGTDPADLPDELVDRILDAYGLFGTPVDCADRLLRARHELGLRRVLLFPAHAWTGSYDLPDDVVDAWATTIGPALAAAGLEVPTTGWSAGYAQANLIAVPRELAFDMLLFVTRNPKPCPVLEVLEAGSVRAPEGSAVYGDPGADVRVDVPRYRIWRHGELVEEVPDVLDHWRDDLVTFLIGCSFTFEHPMTEAGIPMRHQDAGRNVSMYRTSTRCQPAGELRGPLVVSMRRVPASQVADAVRITSRYPAVHGAPVHVGDPAQLGITDLDRPDFGDPPVVEEGDVPVFWACGVTPQAMVLESRPEIAITHAPGHMLITDAKDVVYAVP